MALGNASASALIVEALSDKSNHPSELVREHVQWALQSQLAKKAVLPEPKQNSEKMIL